MLTTAFVMMSGCQSVDPMNEYKEQGAPIIRAISPEAGIIGVLITLTGEQFLSEQGEFGKVNIYCNDDGTAVEAAIDRWTDNQIDFRVPSASTLNARFPVEVINNNGIKCPFSAYLDIVSGIPASE
jgi:hypothetical protein